jgi:hypothetical protein
MNTKKELQLVTFEQAKRLKAAGFDWETIHLYFEDGSLNFTINDENHNNDDFAFSAPTVPLALKWFRDVQGFDYSIIKGRLPFEYSYTLLNGGQGKLHIKGYEAAESSLLYELLTLIEKEK